MNRLQKWLPVLLLIPFMVGLLFALTGWTEGFDRQVFVYLQSAFAPRFNIVFQILTECGGTFVVIGISLLLLLIPGSAKKIGIPVALTTFATWLLNTAVKYLVHRARPEFRLFDLTGYSFPSGHAMSNAALYVAICLAVLLMVHSRKIKVLFMVLFHLPPILIGVSRVYFGVHFLTDVVSGWFLGAAVAVFVHRLYFDQIVRKRS